MDRSAEVRTFHDKSPGHGSGKLRAETHIKNHNKLSEINFMATNLAKYNTA